MAAVPVWSWPRGCRHRCCIVPVSQVVCRVPRRHRPAAKRSGQDAGPGAPSKWVCVCVCLCVAVAVGWSRLVVATRVCHRCVYCVIVFFVGGCPGPARYHFCSQGVPGTAHRRGVFGAASGRGLAVWGQLHPGAVRWGRSRGRQWRQ